MTASRSLSFSSGSVVPDPLNRSRWDCWPQQHAPIRAVLLSPVTVIARRVHSLATPTKPHPRRYFSLHVLPWTDGGGAKGVVLARGRVAPSVEAHLVGEGCILNTWTVVVGVSLSICLHFAHSETEVNAAITGTQGIMPRGRERRDAATERGGQIGLRGEQTREIRGGGGRGEREEG